MPEHEWVKSRSSGAGGCVEVACGPHDSVLVRDSKDPDGPRLSFTRREWVAFQCGVRQREFDRILVPRRGGRVLSSPRVGCTPKYPPYLLGLLLMAVVIRRRKRRASAV